MHPSQMHGWSPHQPSGSHRPPRTPGGMRHQLVIGLALLTGSLLLGLTRSSRGLLAIGLAWVVIGLLARHRADGPREWVKALVEYATVAALVVTLVTAAPTPPKAPTRRRPPAAEQAQGDPWRDVRDRLAELRERLPRVEVTTTKEGR